MLNKLTSLYTLYIESDRESTVMSLVHIQYYQCEEYKNKGYELTPHCHYCFRVIPAKNGAERGFCEGVHGGTFVWWSAELLPLN